MDASFKKQERKQPLGDPHLLYKVCPIWPDIIGVRHLDTEFEFALSGLKGPLWYSARSAPRAVQLHLR